ncbi:AdoMet_MTases domain containing protein [uncultured Caudovirales phage]|jgi:SAM-dependent methyltransferase|uniref:AdoMet_MTases domain containing protein n=1 Tax=uncultured Caudovirales phage TaxID=2100421 RepID=A0A6J7WKY6_9CAUD|nr:AdoMet_MTases domain containing protein [uncultured Caudovirales phage]
MKLSELVALREHLISVYNTSPITAGIDAITTQLNGIQKDTKDADFANEIDDVSSDLARMHKSIHLNQERFDALIENINHRISASSNKFFNDNYDVELSIDKRNRLGGIRPVEVTEEIREEILNRIRLYTDWKYPALEIGCGAGDWTKHLVAADPLYITDYEESITKSAIKDFTPEYQRRVRQYAIQDYHMQELPQGQFSFVFSWNYLNYCSLDTVKEYVRSVKDLLRPGGTFLFSYNDGDTEMGAGYAENYFMSYIPKSMLIPMCESLGLKVVYSNSGFSNIALSWIEVQKPGTLDTIKAHQVMGEIVYR